MITSITCPLSSVQVIQQIKSLQQAQNKSTTNQSCSPNIYKQKLFLPLMHNANMFIIIIINYYHRWTHSPYYVQRMQERALYVFNVTKNTLAIILPRSTKWFRRQGTLHSSCHLSNASSKVPGLSSTQSCVTVFKNTVRTRQSQILDSVPNGYTDTQGFPLVGHFELYQIRAARCWVTLGTCLSVSLIPGHYIQTWRFP